MTTSVEKPADLWEEISPSAYRKALSNVPTSVVVASTMLDERPIGMVIGTFSTVSMEPPLVGFFGDHRSTTLVPLLQSSHITFSLLRQQDLEICEAFQLPVEQRFDNIPWSVSEFGTPVIGGAALVVHTRLHQVLQAGDHKCVLAEVVRISATGQAARPLVFYKHRLSRLDPGQLLDDEMWQLGWHELG